jgi:hypothetical protein
MLAWRAGQFCEMTRFVDQKQVSGVVKKFSLEFTCSKFELDAVIAHQICLEVTLSKIE